MQEHGPSRARLVVLISGGGSNLQAVLDASDEGMLDAEVVGVISNVSDAYGLERARLADVPTTLVERAADEARSEYDARLADAVDSHEPDLIVLAGWMRILTGSFIDRFPGSIINLHPARPGELPGTHAIERAWHEALAGQRNSTGVMVHWVPDEGVDTGPAIATTDVAILPDDTLATLAARIHDAEHRLLVEAIGRVCTTRTPTPTEIPA